MPLFEAFLEFIAIDLYGILTVYKLFRATSWSFFYVNLDRDDDDLGSARYIRTKGPFLFQKSNVKSYNRIVHRY